VRGCRRRSRQKKRWENSINEWTDMGYGDLERAVENRERWRKFAATSTVVPQIPHGLRDWWWWWWW
jgi:hypothetical protein